MSIINEEDFIDDSEIDGELYAYLLFASQKEGENIVIYKNKIPSQTKIAEILNYKSRQTIATHMKYLEENGYLIDDNKNKRYIILEVKSIPQIFQDYLNNPFIIKTYFILNQYPFYTIKELCKILDLSYSHPENREYLQKNIKIITDLNVLNPINKKSSTGERKLQELFYKYNVPFEQEKTFDDLTNLQGTKYRYDFYLPIFNTLIEYDGVQHFSPSFGWDNPKERDKIKNEYATLHEIPLIRIPYTEENNLENIILRIIEINRKLNQKKIEEYSNIQGRCP